MISNVAIVGMGISAVLSLVVPVIVIIVLAIKKQITGASVFMGVASFGIFQILIRMPLITRLAAPGSTNILVLVGYLLFVSFTAGLAETLGRFLFGRFFLKESLNFKSALGFGLGCATIESFFLTGLNSLANFAAALVINAGGGDLIESMGETDYYAAVGALQSANPVEFYAAGFERVMATFIHIMLTCLVFLYIKRKKWGMLAVPLVIHTVVDFSVVVTARLLGVYWAEGLVLIFGVCSLLAAIRMRAPLNEPDDYQKSGTRNKPPERKPEDIRLYYQ